MKIIKPQHLRIFAFCALLASLLQIYALCRYVKRLPEDWVGIGLHIITVYAFAVIAVGFFYQSKKHKQ